MGRTAQMTASFLIPLAPLFPNQRGMLIGWVPVCLAAGIGTYFSILTEPSLIMFAGLFALMLVFAIFGWCLPEAMSPMAAGIALCLAGFIIAGARTHHVAGPVLGWRYYGAVEGRNGSQPV